MQYRRRRRKYWCWEYNTNCRAGSPLNSLLLLNRTRRTLWTYQVHAHHFTLFANNKTHTSNEIDPYNFVIATQMEKCFILLLFWKLYLVLFGSMNNYRWVQQAMFNTAILFSVKCVVCMVTNVTSMFTKAHHFTLPELVESNQHFHN
jgi:hypothetical protein